MAGRSVGGVIRFGGIVFRSLAVNRITNSFVVQLIHSFGVPVY